MTFFDDFEIDLPRGWHERANTSGESKEYWASPDGSTGALQVSELPDTLFEHLAEGTELGGFAARLGAHLGGAERSWGRCSGLKQGACALGRFGFAIFQGGNDPAMLLWVTVSRRSALVWTWRGPSLLAEEIGEALQVVMNARHTLTISPRFHSSATLECVQPNRTVP